MIAGNPYRRFVGQVRQALVGGPPGDEDRNIWNWYIATALLGAIDGGLWVFLPVFLARLNASPTLLGLYNSLPALLSLFLLIPIGALVDRVSDTMGGWKRVSMVGRLMNVVFVVAPFFVPREHLPLLIVVVWTLRTIPDTASVPLWTAIAGRAVSPARRAHVNGTRWALMSLTSALCQTIFGRWLGTGGALRIYQLVFGISVVASLLEWSFFSRLRIAAVRAEEQLAPSSMLKDRLRGYLQPLVEHRPFVRFLAATFAYRVALNMPSALFTLLYVRELRASDALIGLRGAVGYVALVLGYLVWGRLASRLRHRKVLTLSAIGVAIYVMGSALVPSANWLPVVAVLWGLTVSGIDLGLFDMLLHACPQGREVRSASIAQFAINLAIFIGPLLGVALGNATSVRTALLIAGALQIVGTLGFALLPRDV